jgi:hypothetical protein
MTPSSDKPEMPDKYLRQEELIKESSDLKTDYVGCSALRGEVFL